MTLVLAVDPGNTHSAWALINTYTRKPADVGKDVNENVRDILRTYGPHSIVAVEMVASYGMAVGADVFETCVEIGRFVELCPTAQLVYRKEVKLHHCGSMNAKDSNITQALVDRFAHGQPNHGKGTKARPGWFYGFARDTWQAYALAVYVADTHAKEQVA